ncbi:hypothetical protein KF146HA_00247 [Lactococcus lactis]|nr:hypothetical protein [Lactococcus lactis]
MSLLQVLKFHGKTGDTMVVKNYLHTAYANSADGTDGFTIVYPNLNLLTDSKDFKNKNVAESAATTSITSPYSQLLKEGNDTYLRFTPVDTGVRDWFRAYMIRGNSVSPNFPNVDVKPNTQYTFSVWLKGTGTHQIIAYDKWTNPNPTTLTVNLTDAWTKYVLTVNTSTTIPTSGAQFFIRSSTVGSEINLKYPKVEPGSTATPYMPSASEVTTADKPKYIGTYVDTNPTSSTEPSKYDWDEMKYRVYLDGVPVGGSKLLSFDLENLKAGTSYNVQVNQINGNDESDKSESVAFKTTLTK